MTAVAEATPSWERVCVCGARRCLIKVITLLYLIRQDSIAHTLTILLQQGVLPRERPRFGLGKTGNPAASRGALRSRALGPSTCCFHRIDPRSAPALEFAALSTACCSTELVLHWYCCFSLALASVLPFFALPSRRQCAHDSDGAHARSLLTHKTVSWLVLRHSRMVLSRKHAPVNGTFRRGV